MGMTTAQVPMQQTALLIVDVQQDFCGADGLMGQIGMDLSTVDGAVDRIEQLAGAAREHGVPVIFIRLLTAPETDSPAMLALYARQGLDADSAAVCRRGTPGANYYRICPEAGDLVVDKQRYSAFIGTNLELVLRSSGITSLVVTGVTTECCVDSTVRDGFMLDYETFVVADACAAYEQDMHDASLKMMAINFASIVSTDEVIASWSV